MIDQKVIALVQLYKKVYGILAIIILLISLSLYPFLDNLMKDGDSIANLTLIYFYICSKKYSFIFKCS